MNSFDEQYKWQNKLLPLVTNILKENAMYLIDIQQAPAYEDIHEATDLIINVVGGTVAVRIRKARFMKHPYFDWTVRSKVLYGGKTEIHKIQEGFARWYLYAWLNTKETEIEKWILIDLDHVRDFCYLDSKIYPECWNESLKKKDISRYIPNSKNGIRDGTYFDAFSVQFLDLECCIVAGIY